MFKAGDRVRCIDSGKGFFPTPPPELKDGGIYIIENCSPSSVKLVGISRGFFSSRFVKADSYRPIKEWQ